MNRKGFVMIETIVVITVLAVGLISLYASYSIILSKTSVKSNYDNIDYVYKTFFIKRYFENASATNHALLTTNATYTYTRSDSGTCTETDARSTFTTTLKNGLCNLMARYKIQKIYLVGNSRSYANLVIDSNSFDGSSVEYIKNLKATYVDGKYHIIVKFREKDELLSSDGNVIYKINFASLEY